MYHPSQLTRLFDLIGQIKGTPDDSQTAALAELRAEADRLKTLEQVVVLGVHEHSHGASHYLFLKPAGTEFEGNEFEQHLQEEYESDRDEHLEIISFPSNEIVVIEPHQSPA